MQLQDHQKLLRDVFLGAALRPEDMKRSCRAVLGSLPILANAIVASQKKSVKIVHGHTLGATDGKTIALMDLPIPSDATDVDTFVLMLSLAYGLLHHELGHVLDSDFSVVPEAAKHPVVHHLFGIIEDIRQENGYIPSYPSSRRYLDTLNHAMFITGHYTDVTPADESLRALTGYIAYRCYCDIRGVRTMAPQVVQARQVVEGMFPPTLLARLDTLLAKVSSLTDSEDALDLAREIHQLLQDEKDEAERQRDSQNQGASSGSGSGAAHNADGGSDEPGCEDDNGSAPDWQSMVDALNQVLGAGSDSPAYGDKGDALRDALAQLAAAVRGQGSLGTVKLSGDAVTTPVYQSVGPIPGGAEHDLVAAGPATAALRRQLVTELQTRTASDTVVRARGRRMSGRHLSRVASGDGRVFAHTIVGEALDTALVFLTDSSGSMAGKPIEIACQAMYAGTTALAGIEGVQVGAIAFPGNHVVKTFSESANRIRERFQIPADGGTPLNEGVVLAHRMLLQAPTARKVLVVTTDGEPDRVEEARLALETAAYQGIEVLGIGIGMDDKNGLFHHWQRIDDIDALPQAMMKLLKSRVLRAA